MNVEIICIIYRLKTSLFCNDIKFYSEKCSLNSVIGFFRWKFDISLLFVEYMKLISKVHNNNIDTFKIQGFLLEFNYASKAFPAISMEN